MNPLRKTSALVLLSAMWGSSYLFIDVALDSLPASCVAFGRQLIAAVVLSPALVRPWRDGVLRGRLLLLIGLAVVLVGAPSYLIALGQGSVSASLAALLVSTTPLLTGLLAIRLDRSQRPTRSQVVGMVIGVVGIGLLFGLDLNGSTGLVLGGIALLAASFCYAAGGFIAAPGSSTSPRSR